MQSVVLPQTINTLRKFADRQIDRPSDRTTDRSDAAKNWLPLYAELSRVTVNAQER